ncbi:MAG: geranylgeranyl reductase family protein [Promethearchaeota archaeon]
MKSMTDVIVIGAGTAGCVAAFVTAKKGLETIILERKAKEEIGNKVCGDGIGTRTVDSLSSIGMKIDKEKIVNTYPEIGEIIAPDKKIVNSASLKKRFAFIDRYKFGQALLSEALNAGGTLYENHAVQRISKENDIFEVKLKGKTEAFRAKAIIDGSGINSWLRDKSNFFPLDKIEWQDVYACYREIGHKSKKNEVTAVKFEFNQKVTLGGYIWYFDRLDNETNVGVAIPRDQIASTSPKTIYKKYLDDKMVIKKVQEGRGGLVPSRYPLANHVFTEGIWLTGDAGLIVHPLYGGGLGPSIHSGREAAISTFNYLTNAKSPWEYNLKMLERYGKRYALTDYFRLILRRLTDEEVTKSLHEGFFPAFYLFDIEYPELIQLCQKFESLWMNAPVRLFQQLPKYIRWMDEHLQDYPKEFSSDIIEWARKYTLIYRNFQKELRKLAE